MSSTFLTPQTVRYTVCLCLLKDILQEVKKELHKVKEEIITGEITVLFLTHIDAVNKYSNLAFAICNLSKCFVL